MPKVTRYLLMSFLLRMARQSQDDGQRALHYLPKTPRGTGSNGTGSSSSNVA